MAVIVIAALAAFALLAFIAVAYARAWSWTGFVTVERASQGALIRRSKTLWDWLGLLIIPAGLAIAVFVLNAAANSRDQRREGRRAAREQALATDRRRAEDLRTYLQQMSDLMLAHHLLSSKEGSPVQAVARTLTLTVLRQLDGRRKGLVLEFLSGAQLIQPSLVPALHPPKVDLSEADLRGVVIEGGKRGGSALGDANLTRTNLEKADFRGAAIGNPGSLAGPGEVRLDFSGSDMRGADFRDAIITNARFQAVDLSGADFSGAELSFPQFIDVCITKTRFTGAELLDVTFDGALGYDINFAQVRFDGKSSFTTGFPGAEAANRLLAHQLTSAPHAAVLRNNWYPHGASMTGKEKHRLCRNFLR